ncbi:MAG: transglutaminase family protein [Candidatus Hydrogenedens sp.]|nr:transglutaminase family protein [Candidatus Hydrogenedens sp.]
MRYKIAHVTSYAYHDSVPIGYSRVCLAPRNCPHQECIRTSLNITPVPSVLNQQGTDYYGNNIAFFSVQEPHDTLSIRSISEVRIEPQLTPPPEATPPWEPLRDLIARAPSPELHDAYQFAMDLEADDDSLALRDYALPSFAEGVPLLAAAVDLMGRIFREFKYDPQATTVATPIKEVLEHRHGVCQDFAHVQIGCLRALGLAARYVSGYITPLSQDSDQSHVGAQASHAWLSLFVPGHGWVDLDPTNNCIPTTEHITVAWGRDYVDVSPVRGVVLGGGNQRLTVNVDVQRLN